MEQFSLTFFYDFKNFFDLPIRQITLSGQFYPRLQPDLTEFVCSTFAHMDVSPALIEVSVVKQEIPYDFSYYIQEHFRHKSK